VRDIPGAASDGLLVYVFDWGGGADSALRPTPDELAAYHGLLLDLRGPWPSGEIAVDVETVVAAYNAVDCAFVVTGRGQAVVPFILSDDDDADAGVVAWEEVEGAVRGHDLAGAWVRVRWLTASYPMHRDAMVVGAAIGVASQLPSEAEDLAFAGVSLFRDDAMLHYQLGLARLAQGRPGKAGEALREAVDLDPNLVVARILLAVVLVSSGKVAASLALLRPTSPDFEHADAELWSGLTRMIGHSGALWTGIVLGVLASPFVVNLRVGSARFAVVALVVTAAALFAVNVQRLRRVRDAILLEDPSRTLDRMAWSAGRSTGRTPHSVRGL
jgi:hypothetical protein